MLLLVAASLPVTVALLSPGTGWVAAAVVLGVIGAMVVWVAGTETTVTADEVLRRLRPLPGVRRIRLADVVTAEIVIADSNTTYFGGWEGSRGGLGGAVVASIEGERQLGNRSIRLVLVDGRSVQLATWRPRAALAAIRAGSHLGDDGATPVP